MQSLKHEKQINSARENQQSVNPQIILIVEDELDLAEIASFHLENIGHTTVQACNAQEALEILGSELKIDLVFSDIVLPGGIGGFKLAQRIVEMKPDMKILLTSAYFEEPLNIPGNQLITDLTRSLLKKPYTQTELVEAIQHTLDCDQGIELKN